MASQKQIAANRENAKKSTGPVTPEGKSKSRLNALRDGLTGQLITLADDDRCHFEEQKTRLLAALAPKDAMELRLAAAIAWDTWRLDHLRAIEFNIFALGVEEKAAAAQTESPIPENYDAALTDARTFRSESGRFDLMSLYEQRLTRNLHKNLAALREMQAERKRNYESDKKDEVLIARFNEINNVQIRASTEPSKNGFVFSTEEIAKAAVRQRYVETAAHRMNNLHPSLLYGEALFGPYDDFLLKKGETTPALERNKTKIHGISPESIAMRRLSHPEEFGLHES